MPLTFDRISIEPTRRCSKACSFCYNGSNPDAGTDWSADDVLALVRDCARHEVRAVSFGGGEPLEWPDIFTTLRALSGTLFRSLTTNGLPLRDPRVFEALLSAQPDKVHVSLHAPENPAEVERVTRQTLELAARGLKSGVNLLVRKSRLIEAQAAALTLRSSGVGNDRIVYLPMRAEGGAETPSPEEIARVAGGAFQSMTCLRGCAKSERFASIAADRTVAWCSYTRSRRKLEQPSWAALCTAMEDLELAHCATGLVKLDTARRR